MLHQSCTSYHIVSRLNQSGSVLVLAPIVSFSFACAIHKHRLSFNLHVYIPHSRAWPCYSYILPPRCSLVSATRANRLTKKKARWLTIAKRWLLFCVMIRAHWKQVTRNPPCLDKYDEYSRFPFVRCTYFLDALLGFFFSIIWDIPDLSLESLWSWFEHSAMSAVFESQE